MFGFADFGDGDSGSCPPTMAQPTAGGHVQCGSGGPVSPKAAAKAAGTTMLQTRSLSPWLSALLGTTEVTPHLAALVPRLLSALTLLLS